jgi:2-phospho-L-lactate guanylyltransferase
MRVLAIPVKSLSRAKSRLAPALTPLERGALTLAMLEDMLDATLMLSGWETWVVSPDEVALEISARRGAKPVPEEKGPLAGAIRQVELLAKEQEADALAVLPGDLPLVTEAVLHEALHTLGAVVLSASADGAGTSLLLRRPPRAIPARFGPDSFRKHLELAAARELPVAVIERRELAFDVDRPDDILTLLSTEGRRGRTREVCVQMDLGERLRSIA